MTENPKPRSVSYVHADPLHVLTGFCVHAEPLQTFAGFSTHAEPVQTLTPATPPATASPARNAASVMKSRPPSSATNVTSMAEPMTYCRLT